jgi:hypothetical protein
MLFVHFFLHMSDALALTRRRLALSNQKGQKIGVQLILGDPSPFSLAMSLSNPVAQRAEALLLDQFLPS